MYHSLSTGSSIGLLAVLFLSLSCSPHSEDSSFQVKNLQETEGFVGASVFHNFGKKVGCSVRAMFLGCEGSPEIDAKQHDILYNTKLPDHLHEFIASPPAPELSAQDLFRDFPYQGILYRFANNQYEPAKQNMVLLDFENAGLTSRLQPLKKTSRGWKPLSLGSPQENEAIFWPHKEDPPCSAANVPTCNDPSVEQQCRSDVENAKRFSFSLRFVVKGKDGRFQQADRVLTACDLGLTAMAAIAFRMSCNGLIDESVVIYDPTYLRDIPVAPSNATIPPKLIVPIPQNATTVISQPRAASVADYLLKLFKKRTQVDPVTIREGGSPVTLTPELWTSIPIEERRRAKTSLVEHLGPGPFDDLDRETFEIEEEKALMSLEPQLLSQMETAFRKHSQYAKPEPFPPRGWKPIGSTLQLESKHWSLQREAFLELYFLNDHYFTHRGRDTNALAYRRYSLPFPHRPHAPGDWLVGHFSRGDDTEFIQALVRYLPEYVAEPKTIGKTRAFLDKLSQSKSFR